MTKTAIIHSYNNIENSAVEDSAIAWWSGKCPLEWTLAQHLQNPRVNCSTENEIKLALSVAGMINRISGLTAG